MADVPSFDGGRISIFVEIGSTPTFISLAF